MRNIAIFVSGEGESTQRIINLFNEGNRLKTLLVVASDSAQEILNTLADKGVSLLHVPDEEWDTKQNEIVDILKANDINLLVFDHFSLPVTDALLEATDRLYVAVTTPEQAPREVVAKLEEDLHKQEENRYEEAATTSDQPPTPEQEWAETLKINFQPPKVPISEQQNSANPPLPGTHPSIQPAPGYYNQQSQTSYQAEQNRLAQYNKDRQANNADSEPMPSTYLIWSILATVLCCFIPGIIAIIFSSLVSSKYFSGDIEGAKKASKMAEIWIIVSVVLGVVIGTLYFPFLLIGG